MIRLFLFFAIVGLLVWCGLALGRHFLRRWLLFTFPQPAPKNKSLSEKLTQCQTCHTFIPVSQAFKANERYYCCQEHANP